MLLIAVLAAIAFWIITLAAPETFKGFKASYVMAILVAIFGIFFLFKAMQQKDTISKKAFLIPAIACFVAAVAGLFPLFGLEDKFALPIILAALVVGLILGLFVTGGKSWDEGDNQKVGYKNYYERKAEEEKNNK